MCGIAAIFAYSPDAPPVDRDELLAIRDQMIARGPDGAGLWISDDQRVGLAHRRLSIIDLSEDGAQPMFVGGAAAGRWEMEVGSSGSSHRPPTSGRRTSSSNLRSPICAACGPGSIGITFNGEIYNYRALRASLQARGHHFTSECDTEVLLHLYAEHGESMVNQLRGMYAFAIWDEKKKGLFLARDPYGIKPLYYADNGKSVRIASQVKALLAGGRIDATPEPAGHVGFFLWGHIPDPYTLYRGVRTVPAGTSFWIDRHGAKTQKTFCNITAILAEAERAACQGPRAKGEGSRAKGQGSRAASATSELRFSRGALHLALSDSVRSHLVADVPVGVFLSSGLDSTTLAALAAEAGGTVRTITLGFEEFKGTVNDETVLAEQVAGQYGAQHQTVWITRAHFRDHLDRLFGAMDQPSTDGVNTYFVSYAAASASLKVALSGVGGDELFGGYPSFREIPRLVSALSSLRLPLSASRALRLLSAPILKRMTSPKYAGLFEYGGSYAGAYLLRRGMFMPWELPGLLDPEMVRQGWRELQPLVRLEETLNGLTSPRLKVSSLESCWYMRNQLLRDSDWAGMAHSVEIRTPLVHAQLLSDLAPLLAGDRPPGKREMARTPVSELPPSILSRPKTGFTVPMREWLLASAGARDHGLGTRDQGLGARELPAPNSELPASITGLRGLRGWAKLVYARFPGSCPMDPERPPRRVRLGRVGSKSSNLDSLPARPPISNLRSSTAPRRILMLVTDAFGGHGGIAKFNRDLLTGLCKQPGCLEVVALPRLMPGIAGLLPDKLAWVTKSLGGKAPYLRAAIAAARSGHVDLVWCGHINLLPVAWAAALLAKAPLVLNLHGIEAWKAHPSRLIRSLLPRVTRFVSVSQFTWRRFTDWSGLGAKPVSLLPNCVDLAAFGAGPRPGPLLERYHLRGRKVIMTLGRLSAAERYKGIDEILELFPRLSAEIPSLSYLIVGNGDDRPRLMQKARALGLSVFDSECPPLSTSLLPPSTQVVFAGDILEPEKADHYRLADAFVMAGWGEGFGIVYLEAMACGIPVVASTLDASREALLDGKLGLIVDPKNSEELRQGILAALARPCGSVPKLLAHFSRASFENRVSGILRELMADLEPSHDARGIHCCLQAEQPLKL